MGCVETSEWKALEALLEERHAEILSRFEVLLNHQQLVEKAVKAVATTSSHFVREVSQTPNHEIALESSPDMSQSSETSSEVVSRAGSYEVAKEQGTKYRRRVSEMVQNHQEVVTHIIQDEDPPEQKRRLQQSWKFEAFFAAVLVSNAIFLGVQTEWTSQNLHAAVPTAFTALQLVYAVLFILEIILRIFTSGIRGYICSSDWAWHLLDIFVSTSAVLDVASTVAGLEASLTGGSNSGFRLLRIMKIARLARAIRVVKVLRFIRAMRVLVFSILNTLRSLVWSLVLLFVIIYSFGILFADATIDHILEHADSMPPGTRDGLVKHFGSLVTSMNTLFRSISGGVTWEGPAYSLEHIGVEWVLGFTFYVAFCCFAVLNVMTGVFCHSAISGAEKDQDLMVQALLHERESIKKKLLELFKQVDDDGTGRITLLEFEARFEQESLRAVFEALELGAEDAWTLFQILDSDGDHFIGVDEFVDSCIRNRGSAKSVDVCALKHQVNKVRTQLVDVAKSQEQMQIELSAMVHKLFSKRHHHSTEI